MQLWLGTKTGMLHCCSLDGDTALSSARLPHPPIRIEPLRLQYGAPVVAVTTDATCAGQERG